MGFSGLRPHVGCRLRPAPTRSRAPSLSASFQGQGSLAPFSCPRLACRKLLRHRGPRLKEPCKNDTKTGLGRASRFNKPLVVSLLIRMRLRKRSGFATLFAPA